mgnify:FL=1
MDPTVRTLLFQCLKGPYGTDRYDHNTFTLTAYAGAGGGEAPTAATGQHTSSQSLKLSAAVRGRRRPEALLCKIKTTLVASVGGRSL